MSKTIAEKLQSEISRANEVTKKADTTVHNAVGSLIDGYAGTTEEDVISSLVDDYVNGGKSND